MRVCHSFDPVFDDPNLIAYGGLPAVMRLAEQDENVAGWSELTVKRILLREPKKCCSHTLAVTTLMPLSFTV